MKFKFTSNEDGVQEIQEAPDLETAKEQAEDWMREGEWGTDGAAVGVTVKAIGYVIITYWMGENVIGKHTTTDLGTDDKIAEWDERMSDGAVDHPAPDGWTGEWSEAMWDAYSVTVPDGEEEYVEVEIEPDHASKIKDEVGRYNLDSICGTDPDDHDWTSDGEGGCKENPGVWSAGGTAMTFDSHCRRCGLHRHEHSTGLQRNPGQHDTVEYRMLDEEEIAAHRANGDMDRQTKQRT